MSEFANASATLQGIARNIGRVMAGQDAAIRKLLAAFAGGGHVLLEDYPGTGKTTLAKALARSLDADFQRIQFTPDLLPSDILGVSVYEPDAHQFRFHAGPVFTQVLLADEINRASPRTQSALLEAMAEAQVTSDGVARRLPEPFFVIATQNPVEFHGTYPLPEAQMDRFALRFDLGYVSAEQEVGILQAQREGHPLDRLGPCADLSAVTTVRGQARQVRLAPELERYVVDLTRATRRADGVALGASPRAALALMKAAQALALYDGLEFVSPEHIQELAEAVFAHRLTLTPEARYSGRSGAMVVRDVLGQVPVPR